MKETKKDRLTYLNKRKHIEACIPKDPSRRDNYVKNSMNREEFLSLPEYKKKMVLKDTRRHKLWLSKYQPNPPIIKGLENISVGDMTNTKNRFLDIEAIKFHEMEKKDLKIHYKVNSQKLTVDKIFIDNHESKMTWQEQIYLNKIIDNQLTQLHKDELKKDKCIEKKREIKREKYDIPQPQNMLDNMFASIEYIRVPKKKKKSLAHDFTDSINAILYPEGKKSQSFMNYLKFIKPEIKKTEEKTEENEDKWIDKTQKIHILGKLYQ